MIRRLRLLSHSWTNRGTRSLLRRARPEQPGQSLLSRLQWKLTRTRKVPPNTVLTFTGRISSRQIYEVEDG